jgi:TRAP-type C4-dicarboxylate transport system permease small subunit
MLGAALAYIDHSHLGVDLLTRALDPGARRVAAVVSHVLILFFAAAVMVYGGTALVIDRWQADQMLSALDIRKAWFYLSVPVSGVLIAIFAIDFAIGTWRGRLEPASEGAPGSVE